MFQISKRSNIAGLAVCSVMVTATTALAGGEDAQRPDAERGKALAERLCVNCHVVSSESSGSVPDGVPPFNAIANKPGQTADHIATILMKPHAPMPNIDLTRSEIVDLIAYLDALRSDAAGPPLLKDDGKDAIPDYPEPT